MVKGLIFEQKKKLFYFSLNVLIESYTLTKGVQLSPSLAPKLTSFSKARLLSSCFHRRSAVISFVYPRAAARCKMVELSSPGSVVKPSEVPKERTLRFRQKVTRRSSNFGLE